MHYMYSQFHNLSEHFSYSIHVANPCPRRERGEQSVSPRVLRRPLRSRSDQSTTPRRHRYEQTTTETFCDFVYSEFLIALWVDLCLWSGDTKVWFIRNSNMSSVRFNVKDNIDQASDVDWLFTSFFLLFFF